MQKITPFLWFDGNAEEAMDFYTSIFKNAKVTNISKSGGKLQVASFQLEGQEFVAINGGPQFKFTEAVSFVVNCTTQEEVDNYWERLSEGGNKSRCGWLKDKFGLSWQVVPVQLPLLISDKNPVKARAAMEAMMKMDKIIIADLQAAYDSAE